MGRRGLLGMETRYVASVDGLSEYFALRSPNCIVRRKRESLFPSEEIEKLLNTERMCNLPHQIMKHG